MRWDVVDILEAVSGALSRQAQQRDDEQAVYGIDALDELGLHPLIQTGLRDAGYGVWPEQTFASDRTGQRVKSQGKRCDIVLTPDARPLVDPEAEATLFSPADAVALESAFWLEVKTVSMFTVDGPFARYAAELLSPVRNDVRKLAQDAMIYHAGLLLVLFTVDHDTAEHDLDAWEKRVLSKGYPVAPPIVAHTPITDRLGNAHMTCALFPVRRL